MRVAVVFFAEKKRDKILNITKGLVRGIESQGHQVDVIDGAHDVNTRLTIYKYVAVGTEAISFIGGKIPAKVAPFLASAGTVSGKRSFAFIVKGFGAAKALFNLMKSMEKEGMYLKNSEILQSDVEAEEMGKRLHVDLPTND